ncbi:hypothetical protein Q7P37_008934 [Cladosporium fusiforme]
MALPVNSIYIASTVSLPGNHGLATLGLHLVQSLDDDCPEQWLRGNVLDFEAPGWPHDKQNELPKVAREQAVVISEKLRRACFDFTDIHIGALPSIASTRLAIPPVDQSFTTVEKTTSYEASKLQLDNRLSSPVHSTEGSSLSPKAFQEKDTSARSGSAMILEKTPPPRASPDKIPPTPATHEAAEFHNAEHTAPSHSNSTPTPRTPGVNEPSEASHNESATPSPRSPLQCRETPGVLEPDEIPSPANTHLDTRSPSPPPGPASKRQRRRNDGITSKPKPKKPRISKAAEIAARIGHLVREGGLRYTRQVLHTWNDDLLLLQPDRAQLTLEALGPQQCIYTEALLRTSAIARIIHSCCIMAYEYQLSIQDRNTKVRREQDEVRSSNRLRTPGTIFMEAIRLLADKIGVTAYLLLTALSAGISVKELFPTFSVCRDWSSEKLEDIASLLVTDLLTSQEQSWMEIDLQYAIDPAAHIVAKDFSYDEARLALGLEDTIELPSPNLSRHGLHEGALASAGKTCNGDDVTNNSSLQQENTLQHNSIYWSWSLDELFDVNPEDYQFSSGNES